MKSRNNNEIVKKWDLRKWESFVTTEENDADYYVNCWTYKFICSLLKSTCKYITSVNNFKTID